MNLILITIDSLRADHLGCLGYGRESTPNLDNLGFKGVIFKKAYANGPTTQFSFPSIIASIYPLMLDGLGLPPDERETIAEVLRNNGYSSAAFHSNAYISRAYNYHRGFDTFFGPQHWQSQKANWKIAVKERVKNYPAVNKFLKKINDYLLGSTFSFTYKNAEEVTEKAVSWIRKQQNNNFFLWVHYMDVHHPYYPHNEYLREFREQNISQKKAISIWRKLLKNPTNIKDEVTEEELTDIIDLYDGEIMYTDAAIRKLLTAIEGVGDTLVILTSDHGEEFGAHGGFHRMKPYNEMLHVPLIIKSPGLAEGIEVDDPVSLIDLAPTIVDLLDLPEVEEFQGESLVPLIDGERRTDGVFSEYHPKIVDGDPSEEGRTFVYQNKGWKLVYSEDGRIELYNLEQDPKETKDISDQEVDKTCELKQKVLKHISKLEEEKLSVPQAELDETVKQRLRDLGYL